MDERAVTRLAGRRSRGLRFRVALLAVGLVVAAWPATGGAEEPPTTLPPDTVAPATTVPTATTEVPPSTTEPAPTSTVVEEPPAPVPAEPAVAEPEGGPRTFTVTPHNDLVDGQSVLVRGKGWVPHQGIQGIAQCISGTPGISGCGRIHYVTNDAQGNFRDHVEVDVILDTSDGTFDCRVDACVLGTNDTTSAQGARFVPLTFDPAGPDPVRRTAVVTPDTGLVDGQEVTVTGDGFTVIEPGYGGYAGLAQCQVPIVGRSDCDASTFDYAQTDDAGHLDESVGLVAVLQLPDGSTVDCRVSACAMSVRDDGAGEGFASGAMVPLGFDPAGPLLPAPTVVVDPDTGVVDGQRLAVSGADWRPGSDVIVLFCRAGATGQDDCSFEEYDYLGVRNAGTWSTSMIASTLLHLGDGTRVDCRVEDCVVVAARTDDLARAVEVPLAFDPSAPLLRPTLTLARATDLEDGDVIGVGGQGARPRSAVVLQQCLASATDNDGCDRSTADWIGTSNRHVTRAAPSGVHWHGRFRVQRVLHLSGGRTVDCALSPCAVVVSVDDEDVADLSRSDRAAIDFARGAVDPTEVAPVTATPTFAG